MIDYRSNITRFIAFVIVAVASLLGNAVQVCRADIYSRPNKHVIISFDTAVPHFFDILRDRQQMERSLQPVIDKLDLGEDDYISLVNFGISSNSRDLSEMARPINDRYGNPISWIPYTSLHEVLDMGSWKDMIEKQGVNFTSRHDTPYSLLTGSKPYTLLSLANPDNDKMACETYLVMVTDDNYNGCDDINHEFMRMYSSTLDSDEFLEKCRDVADYFNFYYNKKLSNENIRTISASEIYKAMVFKVHPAAAMSLPSVVNYPANLGLKRVKGGYMLDFDFDSEGDYLVRCFQVSYLNADGRGYLAQYYFDPRNPEKPMHISLPIPNSEISGETMEVEIRGWLQQKDDVYGATLLNPNSSDFPRLTVNSTIHFRDDAKAFGIIPIPDFLWIGNNVSTQVMIWNIIWAIAIVLFLIWAFRRISKRLSIYKPTNDVITMEVLNSSSFSSDSEDGGDSSDN